MTEQPLQGERTDYRKLTEWKRAPINVSNSEYADSPDYEQGYADGKEKAHFEIQEMTVGHDGSVAAVSLVLPSGQSRRGSGGSRTLRGKVNGEHGR